jgi:hypothetical protein
MRPSAAKRPLESDDIVFAVGAAVADLVADAAERVGQVAERPADKPERHGVLIPREVMRRRGAMRS